MGQHFLAAKYLSCTFGKLAAKHPTTSYRDSSAGVFEVTHPFHSLYGQQFEPVEFRSNWGEERVYYHEANGRLKSLPAYWTSRCAPDPVIAITDGRAYFCRFLLLLMGRLS